MTVTPRADDVFRGAILQPGVDEVIELRVGTRTVFHFYVSAYPGGRTFPGVARHRHRLAFRRHGGGGLVPGPGD